MTPSQRGRRALPESRRHACRRGRVGAPRDGDGEMWRLDQGRRLTMTIAANLKNRFRAASRLVDSTAQRPPAALSSAAQLRRYHGFKRPTREPCPLALWAPGTDRQGRPKQARRLRTSNRDGSTNHTARPAPACGCRVGGPRGRYANSDFAALRHKEASARVRPGSEPRERQRILRSCYTPAPRRRREVPSS